MPRLAVCEDGASPAPPASAATPATPAGRVYEVWKLRQDIRETPHSFSKIIARVEKGAKLSVLQQGDRWGRVSMASQGLEGWTILDSARGEAGARIKALEGSASSAGVAAAVKAFDDLAQEVGELRPDVEKLFLQIRDAFLGLTDVGEFARAGGLRPLGSASPPAECSTGAAKTPGSSAPVGLTPKDAGPSGPEGAAKRMEEMKGHEAPPSPVERSIEKPRSIEEEIRKARERMSGGATEPQDVGDFSEDDERRVGEATARAVLARYECLSPMDPLSLYVWKVGALLVEHTSRPGIPYRFIVLKSEQVNAFAAPYGFVFVTTGALRFVKNEAELALILAHEIAHVEQKHGLVMLIRARLDILKRGARARLDAMSRPLEGDVKKRRDDLQKEMDRLSDLVLKGQGLPQERESDRLGLEIISRAGYDPAVAVEFFARLARVQGPAADKPAIFMSHPNAGDRVAEARAVAWALPRGGVVPVDRLLKALTGRD